MVSKTVVIPLIRQGVLGVTAVFSVIVLAISAHLISQTQQYDQVTFTFCALGVAVAVISLVTLPVMLVVDILRYGAFTSMIVVELSWLSVLWILWVATAGESVNGYNILFPFTCDFLATGACQETQAIEAFSFLNFIILLLYTGFLSVIVVMASNRGENVWLLSVKESFGSGRVSALEHPMTQFEASAPPHSQVGLAQSQYSDPKSRMTAPGSATVAV